MNRHIFRYRDAASVVNRRAALALEGLPLDLDERYPAEIGAVDDAGASRAARAFIRPDAGVWVVVGPVDPADPVWAGKGAVEVVSYNFV